MKFSVLWSWVPLGKRLGRDRPGMRQEGYRTGLLVLTAINMLNYADRYVPAAVKELIKEDLGLSDLETSYPATGMIFVYMIFAMIFGWVGDRKIVDRRFLLCGAILFWSLATALAGLAQNLEQLVILRSLVGIGEAAYATIAPPMISDFLPHKDRNIAFGIYYLAVPVGGALGFGIGAVLGGAFNWRIAFMGVGLPGVVAALWMLTVNDPAPGINDASAADQTGQPTLAAATPTESPTEAETSRVGGVSLDSVSKSASKRGL
jgi:MFS family permease